MKKAVVLGSGGVGAVCALALESSKQVEVTMIVRSDYEKVKAEGYEFDSIDYGKIEHWKPHHIARNIDEAAKYKPFDYIIVSTKLIPEVQKTEDIIKPLVTDGCAIVLLQNGIGNEEPVMEAFPNAYVIGGVAMIGSANYHGKINHMTPDINSFGTLDERPEAVKAVHELVDIYKHTKSEAHFVESIRRRRWSKLFYNATFNPLAAITQIDTGRMHFAGMDDDLIIPIMKEIRAIAEADLNERLPENIENEMLYADDGVYYAPSMLVDLKKGQLMELEAILGNALRVAGKRKVDTPILKTVYVLLRAVQFSLLEQKGYVSVPNTFKRRDAEPHFKTVPWEEGA